MKLPKCITPKKFRSSSTASSQASSSRSGSPKASLSPSKASPEPSNLSIHFRLPSPRSRSRRNLTSEITEESPSPSSAVIPTSLLLEFEHTFRQFDTDGDGKISAAEIAAVMKALGVETCGEEAKLMVEAVDEDGDGYIDLEEFIELNAKAVDKRGGIASADELRATFCIFDLDGDGYITAGELQSVLESLGEEGSSMEDCCKMIEGVDQNGDGFVDFEEFKLLMTSGSC